ncbi:MAG: glycine cleavage system protein GcvH [bacterium]|nr:glycine cleavage system protein GcvH [bacterium]
MEFPAECKYTKEHEWVRVEGDMAEIGITDYAQDSLGDIVFLELPETGTEIKREDSFGVVESVKAVSDLYAPISGTIEETNEPLADTPELINEHPYSDGWIIKIKMNNPSELDTLLDAKAYEAYIKEIA